MPKAGGAVVGAEGETGGITAAVRSIWAPAIIACKQTLGFSTLGAEEGLAGLVGTVFGAAKAIAYVTGAAEGPAGGGPPG